MVMRAMEEWVAPGRGGEGQGGVKRGREEW